MNTDTITRFLESPGRLPDEADIHSLVASSPWFVPGRLMQAAHKHRQNPYSPAILSMLQIYATDWISGYNLLSDGVEETEEAFSDPFEEIAGEPLAGALHHTQHATGTAHPEIPLIQPLYTEDYFRHQGVAVAEEPEFKQPDDPKTLMVVMSFAEWLNHYKVKNEREEEEARDKSALRSMWQREKLAAALDEDPEEIPEEVFEMAVSSITREDDLASESLAEILEKQGKWDAAAEMYRKLGLRNPAKSAYFASRAEAAKKRAK